MEEIIKWLMELEKKAEGIYNTIYEKNITGNDFFKNLAEDEKEHFEILKKLYENKDVLNNFNPEIVIDDKTISLINIKIEQVISSLEKDTIDYQKVMQLITELELSEWNEYFIYVIDHFKSGEKEIEESISKMQEHENKIKKFFQKNCTDSKILSKLCELPKIWDKRFVIIDDSDINLRLLKTVLSKYANVDMAENGVQGLELIKNKHYDLIISDIQMPEMSGFELFETLSENDKEIREKFIFFTADVTLQNYFIENNYHYILKPATLSNIKAAVSKVVDLD